MNFLNAAIKGRILEFKNQQWNKFLTNLLQSSSKFWRISKAFNKKLNCIPTLKYNNNTLKIPWDDKVKYLGVMLDKKFLFNEHIHKIYSSEN